MSAPLTSFEINGEWTSIARGDEFLAQIANETTATLGEAGRTVEDRPILRFDIGTGVENTLLFVGNQHASELSGREAVLAMVRDLAYSTDPEVFSYLESNRIVFIPAVNVDGGLSSRLNKNQVNLNRDHIQLSQPEARAVATVIRDTAPTVICDLHENGISSLPDWAGTAESVPGTAPDLGVLGDSVYDSILSGVIYGGYTAGLYLRTSTPISGLSTMAGAHHSVGVLSEPLNRNTKEDRVAVSSLAVNAVREWHETNSQALRTAKDASIAYALTTRDPVPLVTTEMVTGTPVLLDISGYELHEPLPEHIALLHGIEVEGDFVSVNQPARLAVALLCDPESRDKVVQASRVARAPSGRWAETFIMTSEGRRKVVAIFHQEGGRVREIALPRS